jgi:IS5 family transposase
MARRDFRQLGLADSIVRRRGKKSEWLDRLDAALDWPALETIVAGIYASREGGLAYPLLTYVKLLLLQQWYGLSDEGLEAAVDDRLSFRRFAGIPLSEGVPDHSSRGAAWPSGCWPRSTGSWTRGGWSCAAAR